MFAFDTITYNQLQTDYFSFYYKELFIYKEEKLLLLNNIPKNIKYAHMM